jgi:hypothetical protein
LTCPPRTPIVFSVMNEPFTYITSFETEAEAIKYSEGFIKGGVVQKQEGRWHVWQCNF